MDKFRRLYEHLLDDAMVLPAQVHTPHPAPRELLYTHDVAALVTRHALLFTAAQAVLAG